MVRGERIPGTGFSRPGSLGERNYPGVTGYKPVPPVTGYKSVLPPARWFGRAENQKHKMGQAGGGVGVARENKRKALEDRKKRVG